MRNSVIWIVRMDKTKTRRLLLFCLWVLRKGLPEVVFAEKVFNKVQIFSAKSELCLSLLLSCDIGEQKSVQNLFVQTSAHIVHILLIIKPLHTDVFTFLRIYNIVYLSEKRSEYPTLRTFAVRRFPVLFPGMFKILTYGKQKSFMSKHSKGGDAEFLATFSVEIQSSILWDDSP